jgi:UDP-N-acetylmuramoyl-tripeptide--D-alanyl-D-alanine ligase
MLNLQPDLGHVLQALTNYRPTGKEPVVSSFVVDSREACPGSVFIAFRGENTDGHDFVADAFSRGAIAVLVDRPVGGEWATLDTRTGQEVTLSRLPACILVEDAMQALQRIAGDWRSHFNPRVIAITGSVGKTTTKEVTAAVLSQRFRTLKSEGNQNNEIGLPLTLLNLRAHHERAVLEMGMYAPGEIALLCALAQPVIGVITMIGPVHLARLGSMEAIAAAKRELIEVLPPNGVAVLNRDDPRVMAMASHTQAQIFTYGLDEEADLWADNIESMGLDGVRFTLHHRREALNVRVPLLGRHSVHTALRAAAVGLIEGLRWDEIVSGLGDMSPQLRLMVIPGPRDSLIIDDTYNSSPDSALAALNLLADLDGRRIAVLGDMLELGDAEAEGHRVVGRRSADVVDALITVGPRARIIGLEALDFGMAGDRVQMVDDVPDAVPLLEALIRPGDTILVKGSLGMRMDRLVTALGRHD